MAATEEAVFAMGCFWCGAAAFADHNTDVPFKGITSIKSGYAGGTLLSPTYENHQGYIESVQLTFDPAIISYDKLLDIFWRNIDPFDTKGQFCDKGPSYVAAIFYKNDAQKQKAEATKKAFEKALGKKFITEIKPFTNFYDAEEYHQDYKKKNPVRYAFYKWNCGREKRLQEVWGNK